jgi:hypothetical protein
VIQDEADLQAFTEERICIYRGETYSVRNNGSVRRHARPNSRRRSLDEVWTFGSPSRADGYMGVSTHKVHRIVATAFHGDQPTPGHVIDHIDTNRRNNRSDNLRWVTRLENILTNPITAKRVVALYGSIEEFFAHPSNPKNGRPSAEYEWMRTVSAAEAAYSRERLLKWAQSDRRSRGGSLGEWIFGPRTAPAEMPPADTLVQSLTPGAVQRKWRIPATFPLCPSPGEERPLDTYFERLKVGEVAVISPWGDTTIGAVARSPNGEEIIVLGEHDKESIKPFSLAKITYENGVLVHESLRTYFEREGAEKYFAIALGLPWEGGEVFDDYA